ncbi:outer membrane protein assembly factor BamB [Candidatus Woesearchaeota archaeon]|nr:outer membrane protein assembly factor BamB [Candidatus Woesearchaeota archaeon]
MRIFLIMVLALLVSSCSGLGVLKDAAEGIGEYFGGKDNADPPAELKSLEASITPRLLWDVRIGKGHDKAFVNLIPSAVENLIFAADHRGQVEARDRLSGNRLWSVETELPLSSGPVQGGGRLFLGTSNAEFLALDASNGSLIWKTTVSSEVTALAQVQAETVVVRTSDGKLTAFDTGTGATRWYHERAIPALSIRTRGSPVIVDDRILDGYGGGKLTALSLEDGKPVWEATVSIPHGRSEVERLVELNADPVIKGDTVFVTGYQGGVAALSLEGGEVLWRQDNPSSHLGMVLHRRSLFITDTASDVWQLDASGGVDLWKQTELHQRRLTRPALVGRYLVVGDFEGYLHVLSQDDGSVVGRIRIDDTPIEVPPLVHDEVVYVYSQGGILAAVALESN